MMMTKLPASVELERKDVEQWIHDCYIIADYLRLHNALDIYHMYNEWRPRHIRSRASAPYFCQIINEHFGGNVMRNEKQLYRQVVD